MTDRLAIANFPHFSAATRVATDAEIRACLVRSLRRSPKSRAQVADAMQAVSGIHVSLRMIDCWTSPCRQIRIPAIFVAPFCMATADDSLLRLLLGPRLLCALELGERAADFLRAIVCRPRPKS